jgi:thiamine-phosphate pyrophosphorylase
VGIPRLYVIADRETLDRHGVAVGAFAREMAEAGVRLVQYRDKRNGPQEVLRAAEEIAEAFAGTDAVLVMNDRADLARLMGWGVHVGQGDLLPEDARMVVGDAVVGVSTHTEEQVVAADPALAAFHSGSENPDPGHPEFVGYVAVGPVFATATKLDAEAVVGLEGVRWARALTRRPLVAIGGITVGNSASVIEAGADAVAVIGGMFAEGKSVGDVAREFLRVLG